ncbi:MAG: extracellular solute-binding protein [Chloroflexi bacterium]|nr:extracellular solute-binding protein [Chloroflexota bacterium]
MTNSSTSIRSTVNRLKGVTRRQLLGAIAALMLAGCSSGSESASKQVVLWYESGLPIAPILPQLVAKFNATKPTRTVLAQPQPDLSIKLLVVIGAHDAPNVVLYPRSRAWPLASRGAAIPLTGFAHRDSVTSALFSQTLWEGGQNGTVLWGLPIATDARVLVYNEKLLGSIHVQPTAFWPAGAFNEACQRLVQRDTTGHLIQTGAVLQGLPFEIWLWQFGTDILSPDGKDLGFTGPAAVQALRWLLNNEQLNGGAQEIGRLVSLTTLTEGVTGLFTHGKLGAMPTTFSQFRRLRSQTPQLPMGIATLPTLPGGKPSTELDAIYAFSPQQSSHPYPDASWQFIKWLATDPEAQALIYQAGTIPALQSAQQSSSIVSDASAQAMLKAMTAGRFPQKFLSAQEIASDLDNAVNRALLQGSGAKAAIATAERQGEQILKQNAALNKASKG